MAQPTERRVAVVMGGSVAGLWAARVLADRFEQVLILERDRLPQGRDLRAGTPQARQYHILLLQGLQIMHDLFPGMEEELVAAGAVPFDITGDVKLQLRGRWLEQFPSGRQLLSCSRPLLEAALRRRLRELPAVRFVEGVTVTGLDAAPDGCAVTGVEIRRREEDAHEILRADLVVDALGRRSPLPEWLTTLGYAAPAEEAVDSFLGYVTRRYRRPAEPPAGWQAMLISATAPHQPRAGLIFPEEDDVWVVMMSGANKDYPPTDEAGFLDFAASLGPEYAAAIRDAEPLTKPYGYRGTESRRRRYERLSRWPARLVVVGDAFCGFNPIYGQGMSVAAMSAVALGDVIDRAGGALDTVAKPALQAVSRVIDGAWLLATSSDLQWPETVGGAETASPVDRLSRWYIDKLLDAVPADPRVRMAFNEVNQLVKPAGSLFAPGVVLRVLRQIR